MRILTAWIVAGMASFERARFRFFLGVDVPAPPGPTRPEGVSWLRYAGLLVRMGSVWRPIAYQLLLLPFGVLNLTLVIAASYMGGRSISTDGARDTLRAGMGVCRDCAHLTVALLRARDLPARVAAVYAPGLSPMDFHAVAEALVDGRWDMVDPTLPAPRQSMSYGEEVRLDLIEGGAVVNGDLPTDDLDLPISSAEARLVRNVQTSIAFTRLALKVAPWTAACWAPPRGRRRLQLRGPTIRNQASPGPRKHRRDPPCLLHDGASDWRCRQ